MAKNTKPAAAQPSRTASVTGFLQRPLDALKADVEAMRKALQTIRKQLPTEVTLTTDERKESLGKFNASQLPEFRAVLDVVDANPAVFASLAGRDGGTDPTAVETAPARRALDVLEILMPLLTDAEQFHTVLADLRLAAGHEAREVIIAARAIGKANERYNPSVREGLQAAAALRSKSTRRKPKTPV